MSTHATTHCSSRSRTPLVINLDDAQPTPSTNTQQLTLCWQVSRRALGKQAPAGASQAVHLELEISNESMHWSLIDPKGSERLTITDVHQNQPIAIIQTNELLCIESSTLCCIVLTVSTPTNKPAELLYVRTDIFKQLNLPGGRYNPATCTLITQ